MSTALATEPTSRPKFVTVARAAAHISMSEDTVRNWVRNNKLTAYRPTSTLLIDLDELEQLIRSAK